MSSEDAKTIKILLYFILAALVAGNAKLSAELGQLLQTVIGLAIVAAAAWLLWKLLKLLFVSVPRAVSKEARQSFTDLKAARDEGRPWIPSVLKAVALASAFAVALILIAGRFGQHPSAKAYSLSAVYVMGGVWSVWLSFETIVWLKSHYREVPGLVMTRFKLWGAYIVEPFTLPAKLIDYYRWQKTVGQFPGNFRAAVDFVGSMAAAILQAFMAIVIPVLVALLLTIVIAGG